VFEFISDTVLAKAVDSVRSDVGLPPVKSILTTWCHSPQRTVGLFPEWYAQPQPDWPIHHILTGFVYGENGNDAVSGELKKFLEDGSPPAIFTFGSEKRTNRDAFTEANAACRQLKIRAVFISANVDDIPGDLPPTILHTRFAHFSFLFSRASCVVHHAGIGTAALAIRAGIPQVLVPFNYDQPDNATRIMRLGIGKIIVPAHFKAEVIAGKIEDLLHSDQVSARCRHYASMVSKEHAVERLADEIFHGNMPEH